MHDILASPNYRLKARTEPKGDGLAVPPVRTARDDRPVLDLFRQRGPDCPGVPSRRRRLLPKTIAAHSTDRRPKLCDRKKPVMTSYGGPPCTGDYLSEGSGTGHSLVRGTHAFYEFAHDLLYKLYKRENVASCTPGN